MKDFQRTYRDLLSLTNLQLRPYTDSPKELRRSLKRTEDFLAALGEPQKKIKFVHIGGTSGKGSVANMMHEILLADHRSVGTYTSPHTTSFLERFRLNDKLIDPALLTKYLNDVIKTYEVFIAKNSVMSFFELSTCLAMYAFGKAGAKWCVLEVGCGGRFDATNVIPKPALAIITNIAKDHTEILGNSLSEIAYEKAGIIKRSALVLCGEMRPALRKIFKDEAVKKSAALFFVPPPEKPILDKKRGSHQQHNAALAVRAAQELGIEPEMIDQVLKKLRNLPCRFEIIQKSPRVILDGAHSPAKIKAVLPLIKNMKSSVHVLFGCTATKDAREMIELLSPVAKTITTTRFHTTFRKAANPAKLLKMVTKRKRNGYFLEPFDALKHVKKLAKKTDTILITGSLFLTGELREQWITEKEILKHRSSFKI
ncbi:hypothetical protein IH979_01235 [Patescibacteria group bacterium]|nr:hypothetical protein [Patescibacteria group bacterium]